MTKLSQTRLRALLDYDPVSGNFRWRVKSNSRIKIGTVAGQTDNRGYKRIRIDGLLHLAHRLAWLYVHGVWPSGFVDHHDLNPSNNAIANLRLATFSTNAANQRLSSRNSSGFKGVYFHRRAAKFCAVIMVNRNTRYLGLFDTAEAAHAAYCEAAREHFGEFARVA